MNKLILPLALAALIAAHPAAAHDDATLDTHPTPHGGQVRMAGPFHLELVAGNGELTVYVTDHGDKHVPTQGASGTATVLAGKDKASVPLVPAGGNLLKGKGKFTRMPGMKVVVSLTLPGQTPQVARFTPGEKVRTGH